MSLPLIAVAHGSRDPRSAATIHALLDVVRSRHPSLDVRAAFLDLSAPRLSDVLRSPAVVVPLLLGKAFHARVDVPAAVRESRVPAIIADVLGPSALLESAALRRLTSAGVSFDDPSVGVVLAAAGSSHAPANEAVFSVARRWERSSGWAGVEPAFASATTPDVPTAIARLRARGASRIAVAQWFLAPGLLPDRIASLAGDAVIAEPLGADVEVAELIVHRYTEALAEDRAAQSA
ncbi:cobalamin biosynthesis protein [Lentzea sp. NBRC 105346]|uniref:sirohydrochlorin chelatase n=1 Tax=Lentzea sp. NBRC 105346 TaxID=3032205 RepID=UPI002557459C|nr:sirohydrochlorin chelatase [Lentzea sp. NBRC 105346]GLZ34003.1 cobalamin biosynthesis protein [Lentzea sp. NBRC 105346]